MTHLEQKNKENHFIHWIIRFLKGMLIGSGAILPGVSGGALAVVFGLYEPIIHFLANIRKDFLKNIMYFLPVGLGALFGVFILATPIHYGLKYYPVYILWAFIGAILGTIPSLYHEAGQQGRKTKHNVLLIVTAVISFILLTYFNRHLNMDLPKNVFSWLFAGGIFASGLILPGLSPSNFLIYFNLYKPLIAGIRKLDFSVIIPVVVGAIVIILSFSKIMRNIMEKSYATVFHFILGIVIASTAIIAPDRSLYTSFNGFNYFLLFVICLIGFGLGYFMGNLEDPSK